MNTNYFCKTRILDYYRAVGLFNRSAFHLLTCLLIKDTATPATNAKKIDESP